MSIEAEFLNYSSEKLGQLTDRIDECLDLLTPEQVWTRGGEKQNAIGNLVLHLAGNVRQWVLHAVGGEGDHRVRDVEFSTREHISKDELKERLHASVTSARALIESLNSAQLMEIGTIQNYTVTKLWMIYHVVEHFSGHTGQIIFATKWMTGGEMGFYNHLSDKNHGHRVP